METIKQLKQDNAKLTERLNNAAKFFREQKAQIEQLTKERDDLQIMYNEVFEASKSLGLEIAELKSKLHEQENVISSDIIDELNKQLNEYKLKLENSESLITEINNSNNDLAKENEELNKKLEERIQNLRAVENTTNEEIKKLTIARDEWIEKYRKLEAQYKEQEKFESEVINTKVPELEEQLRNYKQKFEDSKKIIDSKDQAYKVLQDTYNELFEDNQKLKNDFEKLNIDYKKTVQLVEQAEIDKINLSSSINDLTSQLTTIESNQNKYKEFTDMIISLTDSFTHNGNNIDNHKQNKSKVINSTGNQFMSDAPGMNI